MKKLIVLLLAMFVAWTLVTAVHGQIIVGNYTATSFQSGNMLPTSCSGSAVFTLTTTWTPYYCNNGTYTVFGTGAPATTAASLYGGSIGAQPYQSAASTTLFAYPGTSTASFYLDGTRTDSYTPNGTALLPYKTLAQLSAGIANVTGPFVINVVPLVGGYTYTGDISFPAYPMTIIGNGATYIITGNVTINNTFYINNLYTTISGTLTYASTSATESQRIAGSLTVTGGIFTSGYEHFFDMSILSNTLITLNSGATPVFTNVVGTPLFKSASGATASTVLTIIDTQSLATGAYTNVDMSNGGLAVIRGFIATNNGTVANINLSGSSAVGASTPNILSNIEAAWVAAGSSFTRVAPDSYMPLLTGTNLQFSGPMEIVQYSLTGQTDSLAATTIYTTLTAGYYRLSIAGQCTTAGSAGSFTVAPNGILSTVTGSIVLTTSGAARSVVSMGYVPSGVAIAYITTVTSNTGGVYRVDAILERVR